MSFCDEHDEARMPSGSFIAVAFEAVFRGDLALARWAHAQGIIALAREAHEADVDVASVPAPPAGRLVGAERCSP